MIVKPAVDQTEYNKSRNIILGTVFGVVFLALIATIIFCIYRRTRSVNTGNNMENLSLRTPRLCNCQFISPIKMYFSPPFSKVIRFIRFNRWCNESSGFFVSSKSAPGLHFHDVRKASVCFFRCVIPHHLTFIKHTFFSGFPDATVQATWRK